LLVPLGQLLAQLCHQRVHRAPHLILGNPKLPGDGGVARPSHPPLQEVALGGRQLRQRRLQPGPLLVLFGGGDRVPVSIQVGREHPNGQPVVQGLGRFHRPVQVAFVPMVLPKQIDKSVADRLLQIGRELTVVRPLGTVGVEVDDHLPLHLRRLVE
jgi:hypothetical protein